MDENIRYSGILSNEPNKETFDGTIYSKSESEIRNLMEKINEDIASSIAKVGDEIKNQFYNREKQLDDIYSLHFDLGFANGLIYDIKRDIQKFKENQEIVEAINKKFNLINVKLSKENLFNFNKNVRYLKFVKDKSGLETINSLKWSEELSDVIAYLNNSDNWYSFLNNLYNILSKYEVQNNIKRFGTAKENLKNNIQRNENDVEKIKTSLRDFLHEVVLQDSDKEYQKIKYVKFDKPKLKSLNKLLDYTLAGNVTISCNKSTHGLIAQGNYIKLTNITDESCPFQPKLIELHALDKVFIDANLNKTGEKVQLSIISPTWDIIGTPKIVLDGKFGGTHDSVKARDGVGPGQDGNDGKAGKPGGSAGHFIGIGNTFINGENLEIYVNGGKGGPGQNGGDGIPGKDAVGPTVPEGKFTCDENACEIYTKTYNFDCKWTGVKRIAHGLIPQYDHTFILGSRKPPEDQLAGGSGGQGGISGKGGNAGKVILFEFNKYSGIKFFNDTGKNGEVGHGGSGQKGGLYGKLVHVTCRTIDRNWKIGHVYDPDSYSDGINGKDGNSEKDLESTEIIPLNNPSFPVNEYKKYVRANFTSSINQWSLKRFYNKLEKETQDLYDTLGLVKDLEGVEDQFYKLRNQFHFLPVYKSLLHRIDQYAKNKLTKYHNKVFIAEDKKILSYLYAAGLSRTCTLNNYLEDNLVVDLKNYLKGAIKELKKLKSLESAVSINSYQKEFQEIVNTRSKEAEDYIEAQITPEIERIINNIENQIELLIKETIELESKGEEKKNELIKEQQKLTNALVLRIALNSLKVTGVFLSFLGPLGAVTGAVIGGGTMFAETYILDNQDSDGSGKIPPLPANLKNSLARVTEHYKNEQNLLSEQVTDITIKLKDFSDEEPSGSIGKIKELTKTTEDKLNQLKNRTDSASLDTVKNLRIEMRELLEKEKVILEDQKLRGVPKVERKLKFVNFAQNLVRVADVSVDLYSKIKQDEAKLNKISDTIKEANDEINLIVQREKEIYNNLIPTWRNLEDMAATIKEKIKNKSQVVLDINKWQVQSTLKDVKFQIQEITSGFKSRDDLMHYLEKLENSITFMINLYDRMEYYHDKTELTAYITNIISNNRKDIITNKEMNDAVDSLKYTIQSNIILEKYEIAMNAIKQYIFPFIDLYLEQDNLPDSLVSNDTDSLILHAKTRIEELQSKFIKTDATTNKYDKYLATKVPFNNSKNYTSPFIVWNHNENQLVISELLEGKEITIKADITQGLNKNAIKFNDIGIHFKLPNKTKQRELNKLLDHFKLIMTHSGNNYYKCDDKVYLILSKSHTVSYYIIKNAKGKHSITFSDYDKIHENKPVLSPYATWKIQLENITATFDILAQYKNEPVDLELVGHGVFLDKGSDACKNNLSKYYKLVGSVSNISNINTDTDGDLKVDDVSDVKMYSYKENDHRLRRSLDKDDTNRNINEDSFVVTEAPNMIENSLTYNVFQFLKNITNTSIILKNFNLLNQIIKWFKGDENNIDEVVSNNVLGNDTIDKKLFIVKSPNIELPEIRSISNRSENNESYKTMHNTVNNSLLYNTNNLLFLDLLIRQKTGIKHSQKDYMKLNNDSNLEIAQKLAYREHLRDI